MNIREQTENFEALILCKDASFSKDTRGRVVPESLCDIRTEYQRDRDRIIHSKAFRRLKHKTQVFISPKGDHYRTRLTHTLEVSQISRTVARALRLNEDLTEAIALGHDLGHTPFGHAGESALNELSPHGFRHYEQSVRVLSRLEKSGCGLNLTHEVLNGILCHTKGNEAITAEGRIVRLCDKVAYVNHDIQDALRAEILDEKDIPEDFIRIIGDRFSKRVDTVVRSIVQNSVGGEIKMGEEVGRAFENIHDFMYANIYLNKQSFSEEEKVPYIISALYDYFKKNVHKMPEYLQSIVNEEDPDRAVCDYIAGMTDQFATRIFKEIFIPGSMRVF